MRRAVARTQLLLRDSRETFRLESPRKAGLVLRMIFRIAGKIAREDSARVMGLNKGGRSRGEMWIGVGG